MKEYVQYKKQHDQYANDLSVKQQKITDLKSTIKKYEEKLNREQSLNNEIELKIESAD